MNDSISRCELFNRLATIPAPPEANDFKAEVYKVIQSMETIDESSKWIPCSERLPEFCKRTNRNRTRLVEQCINDRLDILERELLNDMSKDELIELLLSSR